MANLTQTKSLEFLLEQRKPEPLTQGGQRCKEHLSGIPYWAERAKGGNDLYNSLASSAYNIYNEKPASEAPQEIIPPSGTPRTIISKKELVELFKIETKKLELFNRIYIAIKIKDLDETGCNWILSVSNGERDELFEYCEKMQPFTASMREKYNIPHE
jgi:hypothetical protein